MQAPSRTRQCLGTGVGRGFRATGGGVASTWRPPTPGLWSRGCFKRFGSGVGAECRSSTPCVPYAHEAPHPQRAERPPPGATRADLPPSPAGVPFSRSGASSLGTWAHMPGGGTGVRPPGGAREAGPKLRSQGPRRPRCGHRTPHRCPKTPFVGARLEQRAREAGAGAGPGGRGWAPRPRGRAEHSPGAGPLPAARGGLGWGARLVQVSGPRTPPPLPVNYAGGWHWRARVAQVSLATFARASLLPAAGQLRPRSRWPGRLRRVVRTGAPGGANRALAT